MKVVKAQEMARIEKLAYAKGASEEHFMNAAGRGVADLVQRCVGRLHREPKIALLCGSGNNAGDAYVAGTILLEGGFQVRALALAPFEKSSPLCRLQSERFLAAGGEIIHLQPGHPIEFGETQILIDGILGTGFHGEVQGIFRETIVAANASTLPIIAIDIPSGINGNTGERGGEAIQAWATLFLGLPKAGCFFGEAWDFVGEVHTYDFGLGAEQIDEAEAEFFLIEECDIKAALPRLKRTGHKYTAGYVVGVGGSPGMPGAPIMSSFAALKSGAGIVRLMHPKGMEPELAAAPYEVIRQGYDDINTLLKATERAAALFIGPGMGASDHALAILQELLPRLEKPCVIDADALNLIAAHNIPLPSQAILTPHHGEMKRLLQITGELSFHDLFQKSQEFAIRHRVTLVLKGAPTFIFHPEGKPYVSARGDPGMATAGSGDVLTGMIAGFLAQTKGTLRSAILGVYCHGAAGEIAAKRESSYCVTATDLTAALPEVFNLLNN